MDTDQIKAVPDRVLTWPIERQRDAVDMLLMMETSDNSPYRLTEEQAEEVCGDGLPRMWGDAPTKDLGTNFV
jgi:hypothetical protein